MASVNTSDGAGTQAVAISAENLSDTEKRAILAADAYSGETPSVEAPPPADNLIAGKFKTQEDFVKAYEDAQRKITELSQDKTPDPANPDAPEGDLTIQDAAEQATGNPQAFDKFAAEYAENQSLSDESYGELSNMGITRDMVDYYIRGQEAAAADFQGSVYNATGGQEAYGQITEWAKDNLSPAERSAYNNAVNSGDAAQATLAAQGLKARYDAANGTTPRLLGGDAAGGAASDVFENYSQVSAAMSTPEYRNDPSHRSRVDQKIMRSPI